MRDGASRRPYKWLAQYYDTLFSAARTPAEAARETMLGPILPGVKSACDLACGTGTTAVAFARQGIEMFAVDLSPGMCRVAREKIRRERVPVRVIRADMRTFRLPRRVDLVTCEFDALNHVPHKSDLARVTKAVARALQPGGHFFFDVNNRLGFETYFPLSMWIERPGFAVVSHGGCDSAHDKAWSDFEWFIRDGKSWQRRHEHVEQVCWTPTEIRRALRAAGFDRIRAWDAAPFWNNAIIKPGCRTWYLARKSG